MKSQLELTAGMRGHIFSTDLHLTVRFFPSAPAVKAGRLQSSNSNKVFSNFPSLFNTSFLRFDTRTFEGNLFPSGFIGDKQRGGQVCVFEANLCVS